ncbi:MAG: PEP-CTERM sorting domain-containing protein, partial [Novosphingobium sp.]
MSVRMALVKLAAFAAGGAVLGGGAVHVAEAPAATVQYVKHKRQAATVKHKVVKHKAKRLVAARPKTRKIRRVVTRTTTCCEVPQMAMTMVPQLPQQPMPEGGSGGQTVIVGGSGGFGGYGGGFFGG